MSYERFLTYSFIILVKFSVGGGRGSRTIFLIKISQKSLSYIYKNIFSPLVSNSEKNVH